MFLCRGRDLLGARTPGSSSPFKHSKSLALARGTPCSDNEGVVTQLECHRSVKSPSVGDVWGTSGLKQNRHRSGTHQSRTVWRPHGDWGQEVSPHLPLCLHHTCQTDGASAPQLADRRSEGPLKRFLFVPSSISVELCWIYCVALFRVCFCGSSAASTCRRRDAGDRTTVYLNDYDQDAVCRARRALVWR